MKDLIIAIVQAIVDRPEEVSVNEIGGDHTVVLELRVAKTDMGKVIGNYCDRKISEQAQNQNSRG
jgi:predicted RNA-binding protein YlqC (UPF0109 family)